MMDKTEILLFINEHLAQLELMAARKFSGKLSQAEVDGYVNTYKAIHGNARVCFTCGNSAQTMARVMLKFRQECLQSNVTTENGSGEPKVPASTKPRKRQRRRVKPSK